MTPRWTWPSRVGRDVLPCAATLTDDGRVLVDAQGERGYPLADAFADPSSLRVDDPGARFEIIAAVAARLSDAELPAARDRTRLAFWRAYDPSRVRPETFAYVADADGRSPQACDLALDGHGVRAWEHGRSVRTHLLPDEAFAYGPPGLGAPAIVREALRARLLGALAAGHGLTSEMGFARLDHTRLPARTWTWDEQADGRSELFLAPHEVTVGYRCGHDLGYTGYAPERVLAGDPRVRLHAPPEAERELIALLEAARAPRGEPAPPSADAYAALRARAVDRAQWAHSVTLAAPAGPVMRERDWGEHVALAVYGSLRPEATLPAAPTEFDPYLHGHSYNARSDDAWIAADGTGVLRAEHWFGGLPGDGVDEVFHVLPGGERRVVFDVCTDSTQNELAVALSADDGASLRALCAHVALLLGAFGFAAPEERAPDAMVRRTDHRSAPR